MQTTSQEPSVRKMEQVLKELREQAPEKFKKSWQAKEEMKQSDSSKSIQSINLKDSKPKKKSNEICPAAIYGDDPSKTKTLTMEKSITLKYDTSGQSQNYSSVSSPINMQHNLQKQFQQVTKNQEVIQRRYRELWSWHGTIGETSQFISYKLEGTLRKMAQNPGLFKRNNFPKRYFCIDFQSAVLTILPEKGSTKTSQIKKILFRDIVDCYLPKAEMRE